MVTTSKLPPSVAKNITQQNAKSSSSVIPNKTPTATPTTTASKTTLSGQSTPQQTTKSISSAASTASTASTPSPKTTSKSSGSLTGWAAVGDVLNPFSNTPIRFMGQGGDIGAPVRSVVRAGEASLAIAGGWALAGGKALATGATAATTGIWSTFRNVKLNPLTSAIVGAGVGYAAGSIRTPATTQTQTPTQTTTTTTSSQQYTYTPSTQIDKSIRQQYTYNTIEGSPYASIGGSPSMPTSWGQYPNVNPSLSQPVSIQPSQDTSAASSSGLNWGIVAAIAAGILLLKK